MRKEVLKEFPNYCIFSNGKVFSKISNKFLTPTANSRRDCTIALYNPEGKRTFSVPQLIAKCFLPDIGKKFIKHKDGDKTNNRASNIFYCDFIDLKIPNKPRKKRKASVTVEELVSCYKFYFQDITEKHLQKLIEGNKYYIEKFVFLSRGERISETKKNVAIFIKHIEGMTYKELSSSFKLSLRKVNEAIQNTRKALLNDIKTDINKGRLTYAPKGSFKARKQAYKMYSAQELLTKTKKKYNF